MMAEEYGVRLKVTADTADAQAEMDKLLQQQAQRVQQATAPAGGGGSQAIDPKRTGKAIGQSFGEEVGKNSGRMIGKAIAGFVLHQGIGAAFSFARTAGADNTNVNRAEAAVSGAVQFGTMGAMMGGPWGAALGALAGAASGLVSELGKERQQQQQTRIGMWQTTLAGNQNVLANWGAVAQQRLLDWQGSRSNRIDWLANNRADLHARQAEAANKLGNFKGDRTSTEYIYLQGEFNRLTSDYYKALNDEAQERLKPLHDIYSASDFSDSFSRRGLNVGPTVNVADANAKLIDQQTRMVDLLQQLVDLSHQGAAGNGVRLNEAFTAILEATALK